MIVNLTRTIFKTPRFPIQKIVLNDIKSDEVRRISVVNVRGKEKRVDSYFQGSRLVIERNNLTKGIYCVLIFGKEIRSRVVILPE